MDQHKFLETTLMLYDGKWKKREEQLIVIVHWLLISKGIKVNVSSYSTSLCLLRKEDI
jgi:hypothetical protein